MKIIVSGNYGAGNLGDELILEGALTLIRESENSPQITVFSETPQKTAKQHNVKAMKKIPTGIRSILKFLLNKEKEQIREIKSADLFYLGGGGLFGGPEKPANIIWGIQALCALFYKKPLIIIGQSIGDNLNFLIKALIKYIFKRARFIGVRDKESLKILKNLGIKGASLMPDLAFFIKDKKVKPERKNEVLVSLRKLKKPQEKLMRELARFLDHLLENENFKKVLFLNFQEGECGDLKLHEKLISLMKNKSKTEILATPKTSQELFKIYRSKKLVIGMRLHSIITAMITHTPFIGISYAIKVRSLAQTKGFDRRIIDANDLTFNGLKSINFKL